MAAFLRQLEDCSLNDVVPVQADYFTQDEDRIQDDRIHARIFRLQTIVVIFFVETFAGRFIIVRHGYDDISVFSRVLLSDNDGVAIEDAGIDHAFSADFQHE